MTVEDPGRDAGLRRSLAPETTAASPGGSAAVPLPVVRLVADLACPWCYLGLHRLLRLAEREPFRLAWHPFLLNPYLPAAGIARGAYLERKFGGDAAQAEAVHRRAAEAAAAEGLELRLDRIRIQPDTRPAHTLLLRAGPRLAEAALALFEAFFRDGLDIGDPAVLAGLGAGYGVAAGDAPSPATAGRVAAMHDAACRSGIDGVPVFVFGADHLIAGAQSAECLEALLRLERYRVARGARDAAAAPAGP